MARGGLRNVAARRTRKTLATRENSPQGTDDMMDGRDSASTIAEAQSKRKLDEHNAPAAIPPSKKSRTGLKKGGRATRATGTHQETNKILTDC